MTANSKVVPMWQLTLFGISEVVMHFLSKEEGTLATRDYRKAGLAYF